MRNFLIKATETVSYEMTFEAESHDEACEDWVGSESELKEVGDREWHTESVEEIDESCDNLLTRIQGLEEQEAMLADENKNMASYLRKELNLNQEQIDSIAGIGQCCYEGDNNES